MVVFVGFEEGLGERCAKVVDGEVGEGFSDKLIGGALGRGGGGVAVPASGERGAGQATVTGRSGGEEGVGEDLFARDGASVDGEDLAFFCDEETGGNGDGGPEVDDGGLEGIEHFDCFGRGHFGGELGAN